MSRAYVPRGQADPEADARAAAEPVAWQGSRRRAPMPAFVSPIEVPAVERTPEPVPSLGCPICLELTAVVECALGELFVLARCQRCATPFPYPATDQAIRRVSAITGRPLPPGYVPDSGVLRRVLEAFPFPEKVPRG